MPHSDRRITKMESFAFNEALSIQPNIRRLIQFKGVAAQGLGELDAAMEKPEIVPIEQESGHSRSTVACRWLIMLPQQNFSKKKWEHFRVQMEIRNG